MTDRWILQIGSTSVPWTVAWTAEESFYVGRCLYSRLPAICQVEAQATGKPRFGKPHYQRQRRAIAEGLCDLCGKRLKLATKVSLSHARVRLNSASGSDILQVEPMLHRSCASASLEFCPSLKRDIANGTLMVRQVTRSAVQFAIMRPEYVSTYVPGYIAKPRERIVGHAKVQLLRWIDRDLDWLLHGATEGQR